MSLAGGEDNRGGRSESLVAACRRRRRNPPLVAFVRRETLGLYFPFLSECEAWEEDPKSSELRALGLAGGPPFLPATTRMLFTPHFLSAYKRALGLAFGRAISSCHHTTLFALPCHFCKQKEKRPWA
ncbi:hypothetical protein V8G54_001327 [Vigna mungo]|uniref:Uncharacterized protein n=1 Tax=Vigna mungo TaxID=3915 RepID=A0AAQ3P735_VIGMU